MKNLNTCSYIVFKNLETDQKLVQLSSHIFLLNSRLCQRQDAFNFFDNQWLCFFDHDCLYTDQLLQVVLNRLQYITKQTILAGSYTNPISATTLQTAHNFIANQWIKFSAEKSINYFLGGFFVIYCDQKLKNINYAGIPNWGAEDLFLANILQKNGYNIELQHDLSIEHQTTKSFKHFYRRAWLHGKNCPDIKNFDSNSNFTEIKMWYRATKKLSFLVKSSVFLHFSILALARTAQKLHPKHN